MSAADSNSLLCSSCGYPLVGLDQGGVCPECAAPISASTQRIGSAWQRSHRLHTAVIESVLSPRRMMRRLRPDHWRDWLLIALCVGIAAAGPALVNGWTLTRQPLPLNRLQRLGVYGVIWLGLCGVMLGFVVPPLLALMIRGRLNAKWKVDRLQTTYAHSALGFLVGAAAAWIPIAAVIVLSRVTRVIDADDADEYAIKTSLVGIMAGVLWSGVLAVTGLSMNQPSKAQSTSAAPP